MSVRSSWFIVLSNLFLYLLFGCLSIIGSRVLKSSATIEELFISTISSNSFCVDSLGLSIYIVACHLHKLKFYLFLSELDTLSFSCLISVASTSNTLLNRSGEGNYPCLVLEFRRKAFSFSKLSVMLAVFLS